MKTYVLNTTDNGVEHVTVDDDVFITYGLAVPGTTMGVVGAQTVARTREYVHPGFTCRFWKGREQVYIRHRVSQFYLQGAVTIQREVVRQEPNERDGNVVWLGAEVRELVQGEPF